MTDSTQTFLDAISAVTTTTGCAAVMLITDPKQRMLGCLLGGSGIFAKTAKLCNQANEEASTRFCLELISTALSFGMMFADCYSEAGLSNTLKTFSKIVAVGLTLYDLTTACSHNNLSEIEREDEENLYKHNPKFK